MNRIVCGVVCSLTLMASAAQAQSIDEALRLYKSKSYDEAALLFFDILQNDSDADRRNQAEIYLAESLRKLDLLVPALFYYQVDLRLVAA